MSRPGLDPDLARALQLLEHELGPLQVLDVHPTPPQRRPAVPPAPAPEPQPSLFDPQEPPPVTTTDPFGHIPPHRRWRAVLRHAGAPTTTTTT